MSANTFGRSVRSAMRVVKDLIVPSGVLAKIIAAIWTIVCVLILTHTIMEHSLHSLKASDDALDFQMIFMLMLSYPLGNFVYEALASVPFPWIVWPYPEAGIQTALLLWIILYVSGYFQWFVVPKLLYKACKAIVSRWRSG